jgi:hypothetical protein
VFLKYKVNSNITKAILDTLKISGL